VLGTAIERVLEALGGAGCEEEEEEEERGVFVDFKSNCLAADDAGTLPSGGVLRVNDEPLSDMDMDMRGGAAAAAVEDSPLGGRMLDLNLANPFSPLTMPDGSSLATEGRGWGGGATAAIAAGAAFCDQKQNSFPTVIGLFTGDDDVLAI